ncbi:MAG: hypothetical protein C4315_07055 [Chloroflexota bacterium]
MEDPFYRRLGTTELKVSRIGFGGWQLSGVDWGYWSEAVTGRALLEALDLGLNLIETADRYAEGHGQEVLARWLKGRRHDCVLAVRGGIDFYHGEPHPDPSARYLTYACEQSLRRLKTDYIDLFLVEGASAEAIRSGEIYETFERLSQAGKIRYGGFFADDPELAFLAVDSGPTAALEVPFNLLQPGLRELFPEVGRRQVGILTCGPLAQGRLAGRLEPDAEFHPLDHRSRWDPERLRGDLERAKAFGFIAEALEITPAQAALAFVLDHPEVTAAVVGMRTPEQVREDLGAWRFVPLPQAVRDRLAETFEELLRSSTPPAAE